MIDTSKIMLQFNYESPELTEIRRCLSTLYGTRAGSQPLDRAFGMDWSFLGLPLPAAENAFALEVVEKTERYEPRVQVAEVQFREDTKSGALYPVILLERSDTD